MCSVVEWALGKPGLLLRVGTELQVPGWEHKELRNILSDFFRFFSTYTLMILLILFIGSLKEILISSQNWLL